MRSYIFIIGISGSIILLVAAVSFIPLIMSPHDTSAKQITSTNYSDFKREEAIKVIIIRDNKRIEITGRVIKKEGKEYTESFPVYVPGNYIKRRNVK